MRFKSVYSYVKHKMTQGMDYEITMHLKPNWFDWLCGDREGEITYVGTGTVWYNKSDWVRCITPIEGMMASIYTRLKYEEEEKVNE